MISGSKGQKAVRACTIRLLNLGSAEHEEGALICLCLEKPESTIRGSTGRRS